MILGKFESLCTVCQNPEDANQMMKLNCSCSFCEKCSINFIDKATEGKILLNKFEKSKNLLFYFYFNLFFNIFIFIKNFI